MGCDIHVYYEARRRHTDKDPAISSRWFNLDNYRPNPYKGYEGEKDWSHESIYHGRNYDLFTLLAGVRDYSETGNPVIAEPRGIPGDVSPEVKQIVEDWDSDGHTHSWYSLFELKKYLDEHSADHLEYSGMVSPEDAAKIDSGTGTPDAWCQGTSNTSWVQRTWKVPAKYNKAIKGLAELVSAIEERTIDEFWIFRKDDPISEEIQKLVRIVFFFDN